MRRSQWERPCAASTRGIRTGAESGLSEMGRDGRFGRGGEEACLVGEQCVEAAYRYQLIAQTRSRPDGPDGEWKMVTLIKNDTVG